MKTKLQSIIFLLFLFTFSIFIIIFSDNVLKSVTFSISIWKDNLFPALFPFFVLSDLLIHYGFIEFISYFFQGIMRKIFYLPKEASFVLIASMFSGFPSSSKYIKDLLDNKKIDEDMASYLLTFTHFSNPLFIIGTIGILLLNNKNLGYLILFCHFISNFIIAFLFRKKRTLKNDSIKFKDVLLNITKKYQESSSFIFVLTNSLFKSFKTLVLLLGIITSFLIFTTILSNLFPFSSFVNALVGGVFEMTQGIKFISLENIPSILKCAIITSLLSFGGISIHFQVFSILENKKIKYKYYLFARLLHALFGFLLVFLFY